MMIDIYADDENHPIPRLTELDLIGKKRTEGTDLFIVISSPLDADERSQRRLLKKIENYLNFIESEEFKNEFGIPSPDTTDINIKLHPQSHYAINVLIEKCKSWALEYNVTLTAEKLEPMTTN
jgi:hypothetical protein